MSARADHSFKVISAIEIAALVRELRALHGRNWPRVRLLALRKIVAVAERKRLRSSAAMVDCAKSSGTRLEAATFVAAYFDSALP